jgi:hypothetical protein
MLSQRPTAVPVKEGMVLSGGKRKFVILLNAIS